MESQDRPQRIVAIEEHYWDEEMVSHFPATQASRSGPITRKLFDLKTERLADMDQAGVDLAILSHGPPASQQVASKVAIPLCRRVNDRLLQTVKGNPTRFGAFCALPTADPSAAADELERCHNLGFAGAMVHGPTNGEFIDHRKFWPIFARAEKLDTPIYMHPAWPMQEVSDLYYQDYLAQYPLFARTAWGYGVENGTAAIRLVLSGVFEEHPNLKIILGHLGEGVALQLARLEEALNRPGGTPIAFRDIFRKHFWITTSGFFSTPALECCVAEVGADKIMFAVDYPFVAQSRQGTTWLRNAAIDNGLRSKIACDTATALLKL